MEKGKLIGKVFGIALVLVLIGAMLGVLPALVGKVEASPVTIYVPDDYPTIQAAVDAASPSDTIIVRDGTYTENIDIDKDHLTIQSENGAEVTIVQAANPNDSVFEVTSDYVNINGFTMKGAHTCYAGIFIYHAGYCNIFNNICENNGLGIWLGYSDNNILHGNVMVLNRYNFGVGGDSYVNNIDSSNTVDGRPIYYLVDVDHRVIDAATNAGYVAVVNSTDIIVKDLTLANNGQGVLFVDTYNSKIENINTSKNEAGLSLIRSGKNIITTDYVSNNFLGIQIDGGGQNTIMNNTVNSSTNDGIVIWVSDNNTLIGNIVNLTLAKGGITLGYADTNIITSNNLSSNKYGIYFEQPSQSNKIHDNNILNNSVGINSNGYYPSSENFIYYNNSIDNVNNVDCGSSTNIWQSPEEITYTYNGNTYTSHLGNYWGDYEDRYPGAGEVDSTGIWDTAYNIDSDADYYPLVEPFDNYNVAAPATVIWDWYDLDAIRNNLSGSYVLMNSLDSSTAGYEGLAGPTANGGNGWQPIGTYGNGFAGSFDGQDYGIADLFIDRPDEWYVGLFSVIDESVVIQNVGVVDSTVTGDCYAGVLVGVNLGGTVSNCYSIGIVAAYRYAGGLAGGNWEGTLSNCHSIVSVNSTDDYAGGLVADNYKGTVSDSYSTGDVTGGDDYVGGLVGTNYEGTVDNSYSDATIAGGGTWSIGGLLGDNYYGTVVNSYSTGPVTADQYAGGLVGCNMHGTVANSYSTGVVVANDYVGGLVGYNRGTITDSYSTGNVVGSGFGSGGLVAVNNQGTVSNSYSTGLVIGDVYIGGLVGLNLGSAVTNSFWDLETSGIDVSDGGTGKTTEEMMSFATFTNTTTVGLDEPWDITAVASGETNNSYIWNIIDGITYPFLSWEPTVIEDTTPPAVSSVSPEDDTADVSIDTVITAIFSEPMDDSTIDANSFTLAGSTVPGTVTYDPATYAATFTPDAALDYNRTYTASLSTAITDLAGNPLTEPYSWSFATELAVISEWMEVTGTDGQGVNIFTTPSLSYPSIAPHFVFSRDLSKGMTGDDVKYLQIILNSDPDTRVAESGAGSPGQETTVFGSLTEAAVIKFQEKYQTEILAPFGLNEGTGYVGVTTRMKLNRLLGVVRHVPESWVLKVTEDEGTENYELEADGLVWWHVEDGELAVDEWNAELTGWVPVMEVGGNPNESRLQTIPEGEAKQRVSVKSTQSERASAILAAMQTVRTDFGLTSFPQELLLAVILVESWPSVHKFDNEIVSADCGRGIMQITTNGLVGSGSGKIETCLPTLHLSSGSGAGRTEDCWGGRCGSVLKRCPNCDCASLECNDWVCRCYCDAACPIKPYNNTVQGIEANIRDGLATLRNAYLDSKCQYYSESCNNDNNQEFVVYVGRNNQIRLTGRCGIPSSESRKCCAWNSAGTCITRCNSKVDEIAKVHKDARGEDVVDILMSCNEFRVIDAVWKYNGRVTEDYKNDRNYLKAIADAFTNIQVYFDFTPNQAEIDKWSEILNWANGVRSTLITIHSPTELRLYDSDGRVCGLVDGIVHAGVPFATYDLVHETIVVWFTDNSHIYEVLGTSIGPYNLDMAAFENGDVTSFMARDISTSPGAVHRYEIDWETLEQGAKGVTIYVDSDGDGIIDYTFTSDSELTGDEFIPPSSACFIATAAYGTPMAEEIQILREFRDEYLLINPLGQALVDLYYGFSPPIAEFITDYPSLKPIVRAALVPAVAVSTVVVNTTDTEKVAVVGLLVLVSVTVAIWVIRRRGGRLQDT